MTYLSWTKNLYKFRKTSKLITKTYLISSISSSTSHNFFCATSGISFTPATRGQHGCPEGWELWWWDVSLVAHTLTHSAGGVWQTKDGSVTSLHTVLVTQSAKNKFIIRGEETKNRTIGLLPWCNIFKGSFGRSINFGETLIRLFCCLLSFQNQNVWGVKWKRLNSVETSSKIR